MSSEHPNPNRLWFWRRMFAIVAMTALILITPSLVAWAPAEALSAAATIVNMWQFCLTAVIIAYVANCVLEAYFERKAP